MPDINTCERYLPHIDVTDGVTRVVNNKKLYLSLLGRFKGREMADVLLDAIKEGDHSKISDKAHALRGAAGNLGFPALRDLTSEIETLAKKGEDSGHLYKPLDDLINTLESTIKEVIAAGS